jgi:hypothetical protein
MKRALVRFALICAVAYVAVKIFYPSTTIRFKLAVEAEVKGAPTTGETVIAVTYAQTTHFLGASASIAITVEGEALHMEIDDGRLFLMLLTPGLRTNSDPGIIVPALFHLTPSDLTEYNTVPDERMPRGTRLLPIDLVPVMAVLDNRLKPSSARFVDAPEMPVRFGDDLTIRGVRLTILEDGIPGLRSLGFTGTQPVSGIKTLLPWIRNQAAQLEFFNTLKSTGYQAASSIDVTRMFKRS